MQLGAVTYNVLKDFDLEGLIRILETTGFAAVELRTGHKHGVEPSLSPEERMRVRQRFEHSSVRLLSFGTTCEFESPDEAVRKQQIAVAKQFIDLAHDTGALAIKVRPNGIPQNATLEATIQNIGTSLHEVGDAAQAKQVEVWLEVHGRTTQNPPVAAAIMKATDHRNVGVCWNSNPTDVVNGSVKPSFELLRPWLRNAHINELVNDYPWRELFALMRASNYNRYTLCEAAESKEPERFLRYYKALWTELGRPAA